MENPFYPVEQIDLDVAAIYADFLPETIFDAHVHMYQRARHSELSGRKKSVCAFCSLPASV